MKKNSKNPPLKSKQDLLSIIISNKCTWSIRFKVIKAFSNKVIIQLITFSFLVKIHLKVMKLKVNKNHSKIIITKWIIKYWIWPVWQKNQKVKRIYYLIEVINRISLNYKLSLVNFKMMNYSIVMIKGI